MMECYQRGIVSKKDLDGIDLTWGNIEAICKLLKKIAHREGIGDLLADGLKLAPPRLGRGSEKYAMHCKGVAITSYEPRGSMQDAVELATCPVGSLHGGRGNPERITYDSLTLCSFPRPEIRTFYGFHTFAREMLNAVCGWDVSEEEMKDYVRRVSFMERCYSMREGYLPERDDMLPERFFTETIYNKYGEPKKLDRNEFLEFRKKLYLAYELEPNGIPPREMLKKLGMDFVLSTLEKAQPK
jgi:aldehyde:ferredoxin oxidoreductase